MKWKKVKIILELSEIAHIYPSFIFWIKIILAIYVMDHKYPYDVIFVIGTDMIVYLGSPTWGKKKFLWIILFFFVEPYQGKKKQALSYLNCCPEFETSISKYAEVCLSCSWHVEGSSSLFGFWGHGFAKFIFRFSSF